MIKLRNRIGCCKQPYMRVWLKADSNMIQTRFNGFNMIQTWFNGIPCYRNFIKTWFKRSSTWFKGITCCPDLITVEHMQYQPDLKLVFCNSNVIKAWFRAKRGISSYSNLDCTWFKSRFDNIWITIEERRCCIYHMTSGFF